MRLQPVEYASLNRVLGSADGQVLYAVLAQEKQAVLHELMLAEPSKVAILQGKAQFIDELVSAFDNAPTLRTPKAERSSAI